MPDLLEIERMIDRGETTLALPILQDAVRREPGYAAAHLLLARAFEVEHRFDEAVQAWKAVRVLVPDSHSVIQGIQRALRLKLLRSSDGMISAVAESLDLEFVAAAEVEAAQAPDADAAVPPGPVEPAGVDSTGPGTDGNEPDSGVSYDAPQNLDELIRELETARIVPDPTVQPAAAEDLEPDVDDVVSETLARIYANQRHFGEAARVYEQLAHQQPGRAPEFRKKAADLRSQAGS